MDLDNMKQAWQSLSSAELKREVSQNEIGEMTRKKSKSELNKLLFTFAIECLLSIPIIIFLLVWMHREFDPGHFSFVYEGFVITMLVFLLIPTLKLFKLGRFRDHSTLSYLENLTSTFDRVLKVVMNVCKVFIAIAFPLGLFLGSADGEAEVNWGILLFGSLIYIPFYFGIMFPIKWYYNWFYARRIDRIKVYVQELKAVVDDSGKDDSDVPQDTLIKPRSKFMLFSIIMAILIGLMIVAGVLMKALGCDHSLPYYIGYWGRSLFNAISQWFIT